MAIDLDLPSGIQQVITPYPPTPLQSIIFYFGYPIRMQRSDAVPFKEQPPIVIIGPQYTRVNIMVTKKLEAIRVDFKPGGLYRLLDIPMSELFDQGIAADVLVGNAATELNEKLLNAADIKESVQHIERFLLSKISFGQRLLPFELAIEMLVRSDGSLPIEKVADLACMSVRQFERVCQQRIGMSPKSFARIVRFSKAYRLRENHPDLSWISIAHGAGYFDQMHMIRDFKQFAGTTPSVIDKALGDTPIRMQATIPL
jgi:AraC-like DNA-binding protein